MKTGTPSNVACQSLSQLYFYWIMKCLNPTVVNVLHSVCMSVSLWPLCIAVAVTSFVLQHLHQICCCCRYQSQRWCIRSHDCFKGEEPVVWHVAFWLAVFTPWITSVCDWLQNCYNTEESGWEVQLVEIFHRCCSHRQDFFEHLLCSAKHKLHFSLILLLLGLCFTSGVAI